MMMMFKFINIIIDLNSFAKIEIVVIKFIIEMIIRYTDFMEFNIIYG